MHHDTAPNLTLERALRQLVLAGLVLSLLLPWRSDGFGFTPLWLVGMPLAAWWALHRFRLPAWPGKALPRRRRPQARRLARSPAGPALRPG